MRFGPEIDTALLTATALVNTLPPDPLPVDSLPSDALAPDALGTPDALARLLKATGFGGYRAGGAQELSEVTRLRRPLHAVWRAKDAATVAQLSNRLLRQSQALPQLVCHDGSDWHLHLTADRAALADRIAAQAAIGFITLVRAGELTRLKTCDGPGCGAVLLDFSRNRSRRFCDTGNCGNRQHVAAYRARKLSSVGMQHP